MTKNSLVFIITFLLPSLLHAVPITDPTRPYGYNSPTIQLQPKTTAKREWILNTTLVSAWQRIAMINGKRLRVGEKIDDAVLVNIDHQTVDLLYRGELINLKLQNTFTPEPKSQLP